MSIQKEFYGKTKEGQNAYIFTIENSKGYKAQVTNYGAILISLFVKNKAGNLKDVVLGYEALDYYFDNSPMLGATVGRNVNRIENAEFSIDGTIYQLVKNRGNHNIHSDKENGFHKVLWDYHVINDNAVRFNYISIDGEQGFPGTLHVSVTYTLTNTNGLMISYHAISDKKTLINMTNHTYFNLGGHDSGNIFNTEVSINAKHYTPINEEIIPTGEINSVTNTPMDLREPVKLKDILHEPFSQLQIEAGFDHNYVINNPHKGIRKIAQAANKKEGILMEVYSDLPGMQFYTGNSLKDTRGKEGVTYKKYSGFCMEPQYFPNSINIDNFEAPIFDKNEEYYATTIYQFACYEK